MLVTFTLSDWLSHESGLLAVTVFGIWLANQGGAGSGGGARLQEDLARHPHLLPLHPCWRPPRSGQLWQLGPMVLALLCVVQFVARPLCIPLALDPGVGPALAGPALLGWIAPAA